MTGILNSVDEKLESLSDRSLPCVSNQSFATDKVIPTPQIVPESNVQNSSKGGGGHLVHRTPHLSFLVEKTPGKNENPMNNGFLM